MSSAGTAWRLGDHMRLIGLEFGGHVLVDLSDLTCHELSDAAAELLRAGHIDEDAGDDEREFVLTAREARWIDAAGMKGNG